MRQLPNFGQVRVHHELQEESGIHRDHLRQAASRPEMGKSAGDAPQADDEGHGPMDVLGETKNIRWVGSEATDHAYDT